MRSAGKGEGDAGAEVGAKGAGRGGALQPDDWVEEVLRDHPSVSGFLRRWDIICVQCGEPAWGTLREVIEAKQKDVTQVMAALNDYLERPAE